jgi:hypothetical protein
MSSVNVSAVGLGLSKAESYKTKGPRSASASPKALAATQKHDESAPETETETASKARGYGRLGGHGSDKLFKQVQRAVAEALRQLPEDGSGGDVSQIIDDAIAGVLGGGHDGTTPPVVEAPGGAPEDPATVTAENPQDITTTAPTAPETDGDPDAVPAAEETPPTDGLEGFVQLLKEHGITPQQFKRDLLAAVELARQGSSEDDVTGTALQSLPPGSTVDVAA